MTRLAVGFVGLVVSTLLLLGAVTLGKEIPFAEQWPLYQGLQTTAAIIFAVVGAWLAIIFPERLRLGYTKKQSVRSKGSKFDDLFAPIFHSTAILSVVLLIGIVAPLLKRVGWNAGEIQIWRSASFALLVLLTLWQIWTVILTLIPADQIKSNDADEQARVDAVEARRGLASEGNARVEDNTPT